MVEVARRHAASRRTDTYKVSIAYRDGFASAGTLVIAGPNAADEGPPVRARCILERLKQAGFTFAARNVEALGAGDCVPGVVTATADPPEVVLRVAVRDPRRRRSSGSRRSSPRW